MILHFSGRITESFDREFRCLYADSLIIARFHNSEDDDLPAFSYNMSMPNMDFFYNRGVREREKVCSENSSSQSSNSVSSIKAAPGLTNPVYKVTQDKKDDGTSKNLERRGITHQGLIGNSGRVNLSDLTRSSPMEQPLSAGGFTAGVEWSKSASTDFLPKNFAGPTSKFQALDLYDHKYSASKTTVQPIMQNKVRSPTNPFMKVVDLFSNSSKDKDPFMFINRSPYNTVFGGPDLTQNEPESSQCPPPPAPLPKERGVSDAKITRGDEKRLTLGHSKLDMVNQYNKVRPVYSRFELN